MAYSQNGWSANDTSLMARYTVPGTDGIKVTLRKGSASVVLLELLRRFHREVEPLHQNDLGGYAYRVIRGGVSLSNHASGTAVDCRWQDHPLGAVGTFSAKQVAAIKRILSDLDGVIRWGGNYSGRKDEMHFEIVKGATAVKALADKIRAVRTPIVLIPTGIRYSLPPWPKGPNDAFKPYLQSTPPVYGTIQNVQRKFRSIGYVVTVDGQFGPQLKRIVLDFQRRTNGLDGKPLDDDGLIGPATYNALRAK